LGRLHLSRISEKRFVKEKSINWCRTKALRLPL
jgi:hypothetical protein